MVRRHIERYSKSLVIREHKATPRGHTTSHPLGWLQWKGWRVKIVDEDAENAHPWQKCKMTLMIPQNTKHRATVKT